MSGEIVKTKICSVCHEEKPIGEFYNKNNGCRNGGRCRACIQIYYKKYAENNREKRRSASRSFYISHKEQKLQNSKDYITNHRDAMAAYSRLHSAGLSKNKITNEIFEAIKTHVALCRAIKQKKEALNG